MKQIRIILIAVFSFIFLSSSFNIKWDKIKKQKESSTLNDENLLYVFEIVRHGSRAPLIESEGFSVQS